MEFFESLDGKRDNIKQMKAELAWANVRDFEQAVESTNKEVEKETQKADIAETKVAASKKQEKTWREKKKRIEADIQEIDRNLKPAGEEVDRMKRELAARADKTRKSQRTVTDLKAKLEHVEREVELFRAEIAKYRSGEFRDYETRHQERQLDIQRLEEERTALEAQLATTANHVDHLAASLQEKSQAAGQDQRQAQHEGQKAAAIRKEVEQLQRGNRDKLAAFGAWMPRLVAEINKSKRFTKKPIGPMGSYINIASDVTEAEAGLVENHLKGLLTTFCVDNNKDQRVLYDLFTSMNIPKPAILTSTFQTEKYDISRTRVRSDKYRALVDCVEVDEPTVYNHLLDQTKMEQVLIIPSTVEAQALLTNPATVPKNLLHAIVEGKYQYYPVPDYRSFYMEVRTRGILQASLEEYIQGRILQAEEQESLVARLAAQVDSKKREEAELRRARDAEVKKLNFIRSKIKEKNLDISNLRNDDAAEQPPVGEKFVQPKILTIEFA
jgi:chromosome segregation ATPase